MSPRTGRPPKDNARKNDLNIRLTDEEKQEIQFVADALGITRTDAILKGIRLLKAEIEKSKRLVLLPTKANKTNHITAGKSPQ